MSTRPLLNRVVKLENVTNGHPVTDALHVIERYRRKDFGHMDVQITIDDSKTYTKPWTITEGRRLPARYGVARVHLRRE